MKFPQRRKYDFTNWPLVSFVEHLTDTANIVLWGVSEFFNAALPRYSEFTEATEESKTESERKRLAHLKFRIKHSEED